MGHENAYKIQLEANEPDSCIFIIIIVDLAKSVPTLK